MGINKEEQYNIDYLIFIIIKSVIMILQKYTYPRIIDNKYIYIYIY